MLNTTAAARTLQVFMTLGQVMAAVANLLLQECANGWRLSYWGGGVLSAALALLMLLSCPESPRWLYKVSVHVRACRLAVQ
jgi:MFS family permease